MHKPLKNPTEKPHTMIYCVSLHSMHVIPSNHRTENDSILNTYVMTASSEHFLTSMQSDSLTHSHRHTHTHTHTHIHINQRFAHNKVLL